MLNYEYVTSSLFINGNIFNVGTFQFFKCIPSGFRNLSQIGFHFNKKFFFASIWQFLQYKSFPKTEKILPKITDVYTYNKLNKFLSK